MKGSGDTKPGQFLSGSATVKIDCPVSFDHLQQETVNFVRLQQDKIDQVW